MGLGLGSGGGATPIFPPSGSYLQSLGRAQSARPRLCKWEPEGGRNVVFRVSCVGWEGGRRAMWCFRVGGTHKDEGCLLTLSPPHPNPVVLLPSLSAEETKGDGFGEGGGGEEMGAEFPLLTPLTL